MSSAAAGIEKLSFSPIVTITMSGGGSCSTIRSTRSPPNPRLFTKPSPSTLGLNSYQPRSSLTIVDHRRSGELAPVPRVYESP